MSSIKRSHAWAVALCFVALLCAAPVSKAQIVEPLVLSGDTAPGTALTFDSFIQPWTDNTGLTLFQGVLSDGSRGVWRYESGALTEVFRYGQALPGSQDQVLGGNAPFIIGVEDGAFAMWVGLEEGGGAIVMGDRSGLSTVASTNTPAPGAGELLFINLDLAIGRFGFNNGTVVFTALVRDSTGSEAANGAWVSSGGPASLLSLTDMDPFDDVDEWPEVPGHVFEITNVHIGDAGTVYGIARATDPLGEHLVKLSVGGGRSPVNLGAGVQAFSYAMFADEQLGLVVNTDAGQAVMIENSPGSGTFETIASPTISVPGRDGNPLQDVTWANFGQSGIGFDGDGNLYFDGGVEKTGVFGTPHGIWKRTPEGSFSLHVDGSFVDGSVMNSPGGLAVNRKGDMILAEDGAIWFQSADAESPNRIFARRDELAVAPGDVRQVNSGALASTFFNSPGYDGRPSTLSEDASVVVAVSFTDGSRGLIRYSSLAGGLVVNSTGDGSDIDPGNGFCSTGGDVNGEAECTLRAAIEEANASSERGNILFDIPGDAPYAITVSSPLPAISNPATITGPTYTDLPEVILDGISAGASEAGLTIMGAAAGTTIRNLWILAFDGPGISLTANDVTLDGNVLGLDGSQLTGNGVGLLLNGNDNIITNNLISGNNTSGISLRGNDNVVSNNIIGLNKEGTADVGNKADGIILVGDRNQLIENVVSRNSKNGIYIVSGSTNEIYKNFVGTDVSGRERLGNLENGIRVDQAVNTVIGSEGEGNVLSGNIDNGVLLAAGANGTLILDNFIGVGANGFVGPFNVNAGVFIQDASGNNVGGIDGATGNVIRENEFGVVVAGDAQDNTIRQNTIFGNRTLDIDLGNDGKITPNDLGNGQDDPDQDAGPNGLINFPVAVVLSKGEDNQQVLSGLVDVADPASTTIDVYGLNEPHESGVGGGLEWLGSGLADSSGVFQFVLSGSTPYSFFSATATSADGATSEFSPVCGDPDGDGKPDSDGDGLCDSWEANGIDYDMDGIVDLQFTGMMAADPMQKDLFVEVDWMETTTGTPRSQEPLQASLDRVKDAFAASPVDNPNGKKGIRLHFLKDEPVREITPIRMHSGSVEVSPAGTFDDLKFGNPVNPCGTAANDGYFGKKEERASNRCTAILGARRLAFRYLIFGYQHAHSPGSSGIAELPGNDFMVTIGSWSDNSLLATAGFRSGARAQLAQAKAVVEASTIMHEMGHTLNLKHGGGDHFNCKPNYISIMNYSLQFPFMISQRPMTYSSKALPSLNESSLNETVAANGNAGEFFLFNTSTVVGMKGQQLRYARANMTGVDWTGDNMFEEQVSADIDYIPAVGCDWQPMLRTLAGHDDWGNLVYDFRTAIDFDDGSQRSVPESFEPEPQEDDVTAAAMDFDFDEDGLVNALDNCAAIANPGQEDTDQDGVGDVCEMGQADLGITADVRNFSTDQSAEQRQHFRFVVTNAGPDSVMTVVLSDTLFAEGRVEALTASLGGCAASGPTVNCTASNLAVGDSLVVTYEMVLENLAQISFSASVTGDALDNNLDNNQVERTFTVGTEDVDLPEETFLYQNFPNPFSGDTRIAFDLREAGQVQLVVYDILGREVVRSQDGFLGRGHHEVVINGHSMASGVYVYRLEVDGEVHTKKMILVK